VFEAGVCVISSFESSGPSGRARFRASHSSCQWRWWLAPSGRVFVFRTPTFTPRNWVLLSCFRVFKRSNDFTYISLRTDVYMHFPLYVPRFFSSGAGLRSVFYRGVSCWCGPDGCMFLGAKFFFGAESPAFVSCGHISKHRTPSVCLQTVR